MGISLAPLLVLLSSRTSLVAQTVSVCLQCGSPGFNPDVGKILWRRKWQPTPVLLPGKSHGWRILVGCSPRGCKELDMTEQLNFSSFISLQILESWKTIFIFSLCSCLRWSHPALCFKCQTKTLMSPSSLLPFQYVSQTLQEIYICMCACVCAKSLQSCQTLCQPMDCSLPGSSVIGILQARILEWVAMLSCRGSSPSKDRTLTSCVSCTGRQVLYR